MAFDAFLRSHGERRAEHERARRERSRAALSTAREVARVLAARFALGKVVLFGSLARGDFRDGSDVDLAVEGLAPGAIVEAHVVAAEVATDVDVQVVALERADDFVRSAVAAEGVTLWPEAG